MTFPTNGLPAKRSLAATLLCGLALSALCSCAKEPQTPSVQAASTNAAPPTPASVTSAPPPATLATSSVAATSETPVVTPKVSEHELPNFHAVAPGLLRGAAPTPEGLETLQKMGVKTIIDLRIAPKTVAKERAQLDKMGVRFINLPMSGEPPTEAQIQTFMKTIADPAQQPVFVHCQHGADRTGTMIGIYREQVAGWPYEKTYKEMRKYGFNSHWKKLSATVRRFAPTTPNP
jgi:tyrosine-protein phosphatase SIW14